MRLAVTFAVLASAFAPVAAVVAEPADAIAPDVIGKTRAQAIAAIHKAGFAEPNVADAGAAAGPGIADLEPCFNGSRVGTVCSQDPAPGQRAARTTEINVLLGDAATEPVFVMPDLGGLTLDQAGAALKKAGFTARPDSNFSDRCKHGLICGQRLPAGSKARKSSHQLVDFGQ